MFSIDFELNGRRVPPNALGRELDKALRKGLDDLLEAKARKIRQRRCPRHLHAPTVRIDCGQVVIENICCENFKHTVARELGR